MIKNKENMSDLTVGDLRRALAIYKDDDVLHLPGGLSFYRIKSWGDDEAILEVNEPLADLSPEFKKDNPHVQCAFIALPPMEEDQMVAGPFSVTI